MILLLFNHSIFKVFIFLTDRQKVPKTIFDTIMIYGNDDISVTLQTSLQVHMLRISGKECQFTAVATNQHLYEVSACNEPAYSASKAY